MQEAPENDEVDMNGLPYWSWHFSLYQTLIVKINWRGFAVYGNTLRCPRQFHLHWGKDAARKTGNSSNLESSNPASLPTITNSTNLRMYFRYIWLSSRVLQVLLKKKMREKRCFSVDSPEWIENLYSQCIYSTTKMGCSDTNLTSWYRARQDWDVGKQRPWC